MPYSSAKYEFLFDRSEEITEAAFERLRHRNVFRYRARTIKAGDVLEVEVFPIWNTQNEGSQGEEGGHTGSATQLE